MTTQIGVFLGVLRRAGAVVRHEGVKAIVRSESALEDCDEDGGLVMDRLLDMSRPESVPPEEWANNGQPLFQVVLGRDGSPRHHRGKTGAEKTEQRRPEGEAGSSPAVKHGPAFTSAERMRRKIKKLQRDIARMERPTAKKAEKNGTK